MTNAAAENLARGPGSLRARSTNGAAATTDVGHPVRPQGGFAWADRRATVILLGLVLVVRLIYSVWLSPYELAGDEAYYWEQSRHLDLSYNEKGPALAWLVAACCRVFGDTEWAVRLPVLASFVVGAWGVGRLGTAVSRGDERVGFVAAASFLLLPAFQANGQICTQDGPLIALWVALTAIGLRLFRRWRVGESTWGEWLLLWAVLGVAVLFKQSAVLFLLGMAIYWWLCRRSLPLRPVLFLQQLAGFLLFVAIISPLLIWDHRHGWPMVAHTLGHLGAGGDQVGRVDKGNRLTWFLAVAGAIVAAIGPACLALMVWAGRRAARGRGADEAKYHDRLWLSCAAWPSVIFFLLLSLTKPVVESWPLPSFAPLAALVAEVVVYEVSARRLWGATVVYGLVAWLLLSFPTPIGHLPVVGGRLQKSVLKRITGHREAAADLQKVLDTISTPDRRPPRIVTRHYMQAALYSFYLPDHPAVSTAGKYLGKRPTTFDEWPDTSLANPELIGRTLLLVELQGNVPRGSSKVLANVAVPWDRALAFDRLEPVDGGRFNLAINFRGPRPDYPRVQPPRGPAAAAGDGAGANED